MLSVLQKTGQLLPLIHISLKQSLLNDLCILHQKSQNSIKFKQKKCSGQKTFFYSIILNKAKISFDIISMTQINVVAFIRLKQNLVETARPHVQQLVKSTRAQPGNISYDLFQDTNDQNTFIFVEKFKNAQAFKAHQQSAHFQQISEKLKQWVASPPEIRIIHPVEINI